MPFFRQIQHLLPRSTAWSIIIDKVLRRFFVGLAEGAPTSARAAIDSVWTQLDPTTTTELDEWEHQHGIWFPAATTGDRQDAIAAAWQALGGQSPRYLQDTLQAAGFDVYYHGWRDPGTGTVLDPHDYTTEPQVGLWQCGNEEALCGEALEQNTPLLDGFLANEVYYLVNETMDFMPPPMIPTDPDKWRYFIYFLFGDSGGLDPARELELKQLLLKLCPAHLWIVYNDPWRVTIESPLLGAEFVVGIATEVYGTSSLVGETLEASFDENFATIVGTSGVIPAGGSWTIDVTAAPGDVD